MSLYNDLGVGKEATTDQIKKAFRKKAMRAHPDRPGGNPEEFRKIERAYAVLYDPARRARYDQDGQENAAPEQNQDLLVIAQILLGVIDSMPVDTTDILKVVAEQIRLKQQEIRTSIKKLKNGTDKLRRAAMRLSRKTEGPNFLIQMIEARIADAERNAAAAETNLETGERIMKLLSEYSYKTDEMAPRGSLQFMVQSGLGVQAWGR